jgi:hypothetical protein
MGQLITTPAEGTAWVARGHDSTVETHVRPTLQARDLVLSGKRLLEFAPRLIAAIFSPICNQ